MQYIRTISELIDRVMDGAGRAIAWLTLLMVLTMGVIVLLRYVFSYGSIAMQESIIYINATIFMVGAAYTLKEKGHVRVDIFYNKLSPNNQALVDLGGVILLLLPATAYIFYDSWDYVAFSWRLREGSVEPSGLPFVYLLKTSILILTALLFIQGLSEGLKSLLRFLQGRF